MCGTVGLFTGCQALTYCPKKVILGDTGDADSTADDEYQSPFRTWYSKASVRKSPRRMVEEGDDDAFFFSPELVPVARHPLVMELPPGTFREILLQHLYRYLDFTAKLEYLVVNRTALGIAQGSVRVDIPEEMRLDAYKIYCDEAYHTLFSVDLLQQVQQRSGVRAKLPEEPYFLTRLRQYLETLDASRRPLVELLFVVVSETLISASLAEVPADDGVHPTVRAVIRDHAADEGRHHTYFAMLVRYLWAQLDDEARRFASRIVPTLINFFLAPDTPALLDELRGYGVKADTAQQILAETYTAEALATHARITARQTVRIFAALGALDDSAARDAFENSGLLIE
ncbi:diiron oxygenase [Streptomyces osmaniensis]|uniref:Diiron oxygenase n=1 Tax=Streptomyces osmaniensis TaxID=593134 RepID=A0ABP6XQ46_9ACTN|nr:diiron oxygenase [Streptomyces sp. JCM17656]